MYGARKSYNETSAMGDDDRCRSIQRFRTELEFVPSGGWRAMRLFKMTAIRHSDAPGAYSAAVCVQTDGGRRACMPVCWRRRPWRLPARPALHVPQHVRRHAPPESVVRCAPTQRRPVRRRATDRSRDRVGPPEPRLADKYGLSNH